MRILDGRRRTGFGFIRGLSPVILGESPRPETGSEEMSMKKKIAVKIRKLEKIETTINRGGQSG
ncbi:hypothetical protein [Nonomuraea wenchangensis]|uniref:hypothetical protein n=1 Tax=Nonomuraea wenchangensis TaxID=568860 RepID=UPI003320B320